MQRTCYGPAPDGAPGLAKGEPMTAAEVEVFDYFDGVASGREPR